MLETINLSYHKKRRGAPPATLLENVHFAAPGGHFLGVLGAAASGKTTLLRLLGGVMRVQSGAILWNGRDLAQNWLEPNELGYVVTDESALQPLMSVREHLVCALLLSVAGMDNRAALLRADKIMTLCGLDNVAAVRVEALGKPHRRRLSLALALTADPPLLLCDAITDGLDPKAEQEMLALLQGIAKVSPHRLVVHAAPHLANLNLYDTVLILHEGRVCFHGPGRAVSHYFSIGSADELYHRLAKRPPQRWMESWNKHRDSYYAAFKLLSGGTSGAESSLASVDEEDPKRLRLAEAKPVPKASEAPVPPAPQRPSFGAQVRILMRRHWTLFRRAKVQLWLHVGLFLGLPLLAISFAWPVLQDWRTLQSGNSALSPQVLSRLSFFASGFVMLQLLMVIIMSARNGAKEIASERLLWNREHRSGLRSSAYVTSKLLFLLPLAVLQSAWLALFLDMVMGGLPGWGGARVGLLMLTAVAFTSLALGISALSHSPDRAAARAWMLVSAQIPLSGALLALPQSLAAVLQPFVTAYHGWAGSLHSIRETAIGNAIEAMNPTWMASPGRAALFLILHFAIGLALAIYGVRRNR